MKCIICQKKFIPRKRTQKTCCRKCFWRNHYLKVLKPERKKNIEKTRWLWNEWYRRNRLKRLSYQKSQDKKLGDRIIEKRRRTYLRHRKKRISEAVIYAKNHKEQKQIIQQKRRAEKRNNGGSFSLKDWRALKKKYNDTCLRCKRRDPEIKLTIDHIVPLLFGGKHSKENIQPLCFSCNASKGIKIKDYRFN